MSKSIIYAGNSTSQATSASGTVIQFPNIVRRYGCNLNLSGGNVVAQGSGYYEGDVSLTIDGTADGTAVVQVYENGTAIPYATASIATSATSLNSISIPFVVRNNCNCVSKNITVSVSGVATNVLNAGIVVEKE